MPQHRSPGQGWVGNPSCIAQTHPAAPGNPAHFQQPLLGDCSNCIIVQETMHLCDCIWSSPKTQLSLFELQRDLSFQALYPSGSLTSWSKKRTYAPIFQLTVSVRLKPASNTFQSLDLQLSLWLAGCTAGKAAWLKLRFVTANHRAAVSMLQGLQCKGSKCERKLPVGGEGLQI